MIKKLFFIMGLFIILVSLQAVCYGVTEGTTNDGLEYQIVDDKVTITGYVGSNSEVIIPETIEGYEVTTIGDSSFRWNYNITSITFTKNIIKIDNGAFMGCLNLKNLYQTENIQYIDIDAFNSCSSLEKIDFKNVIEMGDSAFFGCSKLSSIGDLNNLTSIGNFVFIECDSLKNINIPNSVTSIGDEAFSCCDGLEYINIPDSVNSIGNEAFSFCINLKYINIPNSVNSIGDGAFEYCDNLEKINIPRNISNVNAWTFNNYYNLKEITVDKNNNYYTSDNGVLFNKDKTNLIAYPNNKPETEYEIPNTVINIGSFTNCKNLVTITIPGSIKAISSINKYYEIFGQCPKLKNVKIEHGVEKISSYAFWSCENLENINIPESITEIGSSAFYNCKSLKNLAIPSSVTKLGGYNFTGLSKDFTLYCYSNSCVYWLARQRTIRTALLDREVIQAATEKYRYEIGSGEVTIIEYFDKDVQTVEIPEIIEEFPVCTIGEKVFANCKNLQAITIPRSVEKIEDNTFENCSNFTINGYSKSASETFSKNHNITFNRIGNPFYTVTFKDYNGTILKQIDIEEGCDVEPNDIPNNFNRNGFIFVGWDKDAKNITSDTVITAKYIEKVSSKFNDVKSNSWYEESVQYVFNNNMISGLNKNTFGPFVKLTRGMLVTILYRMENMPKVTGEPRFTDVKDSRQFYYQPVKWATDNKLVNGYTNGKFGPNDNITREQLAIILRNYAKYKGKDISKTDDLREFTDTEKITYYAVDAIKWAVGSGVITGNADKTLNPKGTATRAEVAAMLTKYCKQIGR